MKHLRYLLLIIIFLNCVSCEKDFLDKRPMDKLDSEALLSNPEGRLSYMANLYYQLPIEDFLFCFKGFNWRSNNNGKYPALSTDEAVHSEANLKSFLHNNNELKWWDEGYTLIRDVNLLFDVIPTLDLNETEYNELYGQACFIRAFAYFGLAKRYGGVPLIKELQVYDGDVEKLKVERSTEKDTWDYVLEECDNAIQYLPEQWLDGSTRRATKWAAYALKSRAALHAASVAKYWNEAPLSGPAVDLGLIGLDASLANAYYEECITASEAIMNAGFTLYGESPSSPEDAAENYRSMFEHPNSALNEVIFIKGFSIPTLGHAYDFWLSPNQTSNGAAHPGRMNPTLELVDLYESYSNPGQSSPIITTVDGDFENYNGYDATRIYLRFDEPYEIFEGKDARLWGTVVLPGTTWKGTKIVIQGGFVKPDGTVAIETDESIDVGGVTYYTYGAADYTQFSGFKVLGGRMTKSGFSFKKFLSQEDIPPELNQSTTDWIEFRYGEVLLNYAEAVVESGYTANGASAKAAQALNDIRARAGHTSNIPLTLDNVLRERRVELAFENRRNWDLMRRREYHSQLHNTTKHALVPLLDLTVDPPQYIFVRKQASREKFRTFFPYEYYRYIPDVAASELVQNPEY